MNEEELQNIVEHLTDEDLQAYAEALIEDRLYLTEDNEDIEYESCNFNSN